MSFFQNGLIFFAITNTSAIKRIALINIQIIYISPIYFFCKGPESLILSLLHAVVIIMTRDPQQGS